MMPGPDCSPSARRQAIVFLTHRFSPAVMQAFQTLREEAQAFGDVFMFGDRRTAPPQGEDASFCTFDFDLLKQDFPNPLGDTVIPGNVHLVYWDFLRRHPHYEHLWFIEYDVRFSGSWSGFFRTHQDLAADLIGCHLRPWSREPDWCWWRTLASPQGAVPEAHRWRGFFPVLRLSANALRTVMAHVEEGWRGHFETLIPTVLVRSGFTVLDLEGPSSGTPAAGVRRYCTCSDSQNGKLTGFGTMRFRPPHLFWGLRSDMLYHPVKDDEAIGDLLFRNGWLKARTAVRRLARMARGKPV